MPRSCVGFLLVKMELIYLKHWVASSLIIITFSCQDKSILLRQNKNKSDGGFVFT